MHFQFIDSEKFWSYLTILFALFVTQGSYLIGDWSTPPAVVYPPSSPFTAIFPSIAADPSGNCVAVWYDVSDSGSLQGGTLAAGAVNSIGQPNWIITNPISSSNVQSQYNFYGQIVGMDGKGNATAIWSDGAQIFASRLPLGGSSWSSPIAINNVAIGEEVANPYIAVAANGNIVATWSRSSTSYNGKVIANVFDAKAQNWLGEENLSGDGIEQNIDSSPIAIDPVGNAVVLLKNNTDDIQAVSYNFTTAIWTKIPSISENYVLSIAGAMDAKGNATIVWEEENGSILAAILSLNQSEFSNKKTLSTQALFPFSFPQVTSDSSGNGVALWVDETQKLASARYSPTTGGWTGLPLINPSEEGAFLPYLSGDARGYTLATWVSGVFPDSGYIEVAALSPSDTTWLPQSKLSSSTSGTDFISRVILARQNGVAIWESDALVFIDGGKIESSISLNAFAPSIALISPNSGPVGGETSVAITGKGLTYTQAVYFGTKKAEKFTVNSDSQITAISPRGKGVVNVTVETAYGTSPISADSQFTYNNIYPPKHVKASQLPCFPEKKVTNIITWSPPKKGKRAVSYKIYADRDLTDLIATRKAGPHQKHFHFKDKCVREKDKYRYFIVSVDKSGNQSRAVVAKIKTKETPGISEIFHCDCFF